MKRIVIFIGYLWRVLAGLLEVAIVLYVFSRLNTRFEFIVVSIFRFMYGSLRIIGIGLWQMLSQLGVSVDREFGKLRQDERERHHDGHIEEQARLHLLAETKLKQARLLLSPPEVVFEELKKQAQRPRNEWYRYYYGAEEIESTLLERNDALINLGLACFGSNREVFQTLYKHGLTPPENSADATYKRGLRIGCLSNQVLAKESSGERLSSRSYRRARNAAHHCSRGRRGNHRSHAQSKCV